MWYHIWSFVDHYKNPKTNLEEFVYVCVPMFVDVSQICIVAIRINDTHEISDNPDILQNMMKSKLYSDCSFPEICLIRKPISSTVGFFQNKYMCMYVHVCLRMPKYPEDVFKFKLTFVSSLHSLFAMLEFWIFISKGLLGTILFLKEILYYSYSVGQFSSSIFTANSQTLAE